MRAAGMKQLRMRAKKNEITDSLNSSNFCEGFATGNDYLGNNRLVGLTGI